jgi:hypothetical protein
MLKNVFSFCIYGNQLKYTEGLVRNLQQIQQYYPTFETWITVGSDTPQDYIEKYKTFPNVKLIFSNETGGRLMAYRFFAIDDPDVDIMIVRDADSRFTYRDQWCINKFLVSSNAIFTIRDHMWHQKEMMGGQWGMQKILGLNIQEKYNEFKQKCQNLDAYSSDQDFLRDYIYTPYKSHIVVFTSIYRFEGETCQTIELHRENACDFCGNVILFRKNYMDQLEEYPEFSVSGRIA